MKTTKQKRPLRWPDDHLELQICIGTMLSRNLPLDRPTQYHVKSGRVNFYPTTGAISIDGVGRVDDVGVYAFMSLAETDFYRNVRSLLTTKAPSGPDRSPASAKIEGRTASPWRPKG